MRTIKGVMVALVMTLGLAGCAANSQNEPETSEPETIVRVENQNYLDMAIYVLERGRRVRIGTVPGVSTRDLVIPERMIFGISSLSFQADPVGASRSPVSQEIPVSPGDRVRLIIPPS